MEMDTGPCLPVSCSYPLHSLTIADVRFKQLSESTGTTPEKVFAQSLPLVLPLIVVFIKAAPLFRP